MCTLTIIKTTGGVRAVMNRDEQHTRAPGEPPAWRELPDGRVGVWPRDVNAGGTWFAAVRGGLLVALLNGNPTPTPPAPTDPRSRGEIPLRVMGLESIADVDPLLSTLPLSAYRPFRLVVCDPHASDLIARDWFWDGSELAEAGGIPAVRDAQGFCYVSSGLGDTLMLPRLDLYREMVIADPGPSAQDAYHRHVWPDRRSASVMMHREEARTVSVTTLEVTGDQIEMEHEDISPEVAKAAI